MPQLEHIEAIEKRLWNAADTLRANSNYASNEYFLPVMDLVFLRHAYSRYLAVPKTEYQELDNVLLGQLLCTLNPDELKKVSGDIFGRIYEFFLTQFADQKAHDGGQFFTPISLVSLIAHVLDPATGSGGMFVQSARIVEEQGQSPTDRLTFRGLEKNATTIRLAKMNLAVHGLEGDIQRAITYYEDPHELVGKADYVMANPPFNVDEIDADKVKTDPRLPFGLSGVNKKDKFSNGNYIWISYFYSYLNEGRRAGFVMSSRASSAGGGEAKVRYFWKQARWPAERFPEAKLCDVEGLVKLVDRDEIAANDWSLTPGRYVGVAPEEVEEDFDFEEALREIHVELEDLNAEAAKLAATIKNNFEELGI
jgi:type I restriction enzyme M protein